MQENNKKNYKNLPATLQAGRRIPALMLGNTGGWKHWLGKEPLWKWVL